MSKPESNGAQSSTKVDFLGASIDNLTWDETIERLFELVANKEPSYVVTPNVDHIMRLQQSPEFREIYKSAALVLADGMPILWGTRFLGQTLKKKISGSDLLPKVASEAAKRKCSLFFLGGRKGAAAKAAEVFTSHYPGLNVCGHYCPPWGFEYNSDELYKIEKLIKEAKPDILFVGLGSPKQENWIFKYHQKIGVPVSIGSGVSFEFIAGFVKRAPGWMQNCGFEWFWRLLMEPRRLWKRYLLTDMPFFRLLLREKFFAGRSK